MKIRTNKAIAKIFRDFADRIENGTCGVDAETLSTAANMLIHIKLTAEETCAYLGVSRATLTRMVADGRCPRPHKTRGGDKYWYQDEIEEWLIDYKEKYGVDAI